MRMNFDTGDVSLRRQFKHRRTLGKCIWILRQNLFPAFQANDAHELRHLQRKLSVFAVYLGSSSYSIELSGLTVRFLNAILGVICWG
jgi:hypothetical protein